MVSDNNDILGDSFAREVLILVVVEYGLGHDFQYAEVSINGS